MSNSSALIIYTLLKTMKQTFVLNLKGFVLFYSCERQRQVQNLICLTLLVNFIG